jgi:hypothetical protein
MSFIEIVPLSLYSPFFRCFRTWGAVILNTSSGFFAYFGINIFSKLGSLRSQYIVHCSTFILNLYFSHYTVVIKAHLYVFSEYKCHRLEYLGCSSLLLDTHSEK